MALHAIISTMTEPNPSAWQRFWKRITGHADSKSSLAATEGTAAQPAPPAPSAPSADKPVTLSAARNEDEYRRECARHLYDRYADRIFQGMMPPMLYAIGSLELYLDAQGRIEGLNWLREPSHAPEVVQQIEDMVYDAAPFPAAPRLAQTIYTDTWLWDESGRFQLHTLTEGQR